MIAALSAEKLIYRRRETRNWALEPQGGREGDPFSEESCIHREAEREREGARAREEETGVESVEERGKNR